MEDDDDVASSLTSKAAASIMGALLERSGIPVIASTLR